MSKFSGMPSCSCEVSAATWDVSSHPDSSTLGTAITEVVAVQARLWKGGAWKVKNIVARNSMEITEVLFQEDLGHLAGKWTEMCHWTHQRPRTPNIFCFIPLVIHGSKFTTAFSKGEYWFG